MIFLELIMRIGGHGLIPAQTAMNAKVFVERKKSLWKLIKKYKSNEEVTKSDIKYKGEFK